MTNSATRYDDEFATSFVHLLLRHWRGSGISRDALFVLVALAVQKPAPPYMGPVHLWDTDAMVSLGFSSLRAFSAARAHAVDRGWLRYESGNGNTPGRYWPLVPEPIAAQYQREVAHAN